MSCELQKMQTKIKDSLLAAVVMLHYNNMSIIIIVDLDTGEG